MSDDQAGISTSIAPQRKQKQVTPITERRDWYFEEWLQSNQYLPPKLPPISLNLDFFFFASSFIT